MKRFFKSLLLKVPFINDLRTQRDTLFNENNLLINERKTRIDQIKSLQIGKEEITNKYNIANSQLTELKNKLSYFENNNNIYPPFVEHGHFYSPIPSKEDVESLVINKINSSIPGINLNTERQLHLVDKFVTFYDQIPFSDIKTKGLRYYFDNRSYSYSDAISLYCMIRFLNPERIIEVGSGFSSCVTLDTNELFFDNKIECTFIEPYPDLLKSLVKSEDFGRIKIHESKLQDVDLAMFKQLKANDILFIDSTHVSKLNSDVNYLIHNILPVLNDGVYIHIHDVFYPFEYPEHWFRGGRAWNEQYILRAFLEFNSQFEIVYFNTYLQAFYPDTFKEKMPLVLKNPGGSIWIRKILL